MSLLDRLGPSPALAALAHEEAVWIVGGAVRDLLLGREPRELDFVVEGDAVAVARRAARRLGGRVRVHDRFGTATVEGRGLSFDLAGARRERYERPGALPEVELGASLREDLARRDFSVNAIGLHLADGALAEWPGARGDLAARRLRVLHERSFRDDPTRILRLARYAARLGFAAEPATASLAAAAVRAGAFGTVTGARLGAELRLLLREPQPAGLRALERHGAGEALLGPGFAAGERLTHALALAPADARADLVSLAAALATASQPRAAIADRLDALAFPAAERGIVVPAAAGADALAHALQRDGGDDVALWRLLRRRSPEAVAVAGAFDPGGPGERAARRWLGELRHRRLAITGDDLVAAGLSGPPVGAALDAAHEAMLAGAAPTREAQLRAGLHAVGA